MSSFLTVIVGIVLLGGALFFAFDAGVETGRLGPKRASAPAIISFILAVIAILFLLARS